MLRANLVRAHRYTTDCIRDMRSKLLHALEDLAYERPIKAEWASMCADAKIKFPSASRILEDNYGDFIDMASEHVEDATADQLNAYYCEKFGECDVCETRW